MKKYLLIGLLASTLGVFSASAETGDPTHELQNLVYYPHAFENVLNANYQMSLSYSGAVIDDTGTQTRSTTTNFYQMTLGWGHGFSDGFRMNISETELFDQSIGNANYNTGASTTSHANGISSPTVSATWRLIQSSALGIFMDSTFSVTPVIGTRLAATSGQTGNNLASAWTGSFTFPLYWYWKENEFEMATSVSHNFGATSQGPTLATSTTSDPYWTASMTFTDRYHFNNSFYVQPTLVFELPYSVETTNQGSSVTTSYLHDFYCNPQIQAGFLPNENWVVTVALSYINNSYTSASTSRSPNDFDNNETILIVGTRFSL